jgi:hypothetical protein
LRYKTYKLSEHQKNLSIGDEVKVSSDIRHADEEPTETKIVSFPESYRDIPGGN